jgi:hypothetical protein
MAITATSRGWALLGAVCLHLCLALGTEGDPIRPEEECAVAAGNNGTCREAIADHTCISCICHIVCIVCCRLYALLLQYPWHGQ